MYFFKKLIVCLLLFVLPKSAFALHIIFENNVETHETTGEGIVTSFVEDTITLLPPYIIKMMKLNIENLVKTSEFRVGSDYWRRKIISKSKFKENYERIINERKNGAHDNVIVEQLGKTVRDIFEVSMSVEKPDPMNEIVQQNMLTYLNSGNKVESEVNYSGYKTESLDVLIDQLFENRKSLKKSDMYAQMIVVTAKLWTHIWNVTGNQVTELSQRFTRKQFQIRTKTADERYVLEREAYQNEHERYMAELNNNLNKIIQNRISNYSYSRSSVQNNSIPTEQYSTPKSNTVTYRAADYTTYSPPSSIQSQDTNKLDEVKKTAIDAISGSKWSK
jgi:hypothetical protein